MIVLLLLELLLDQLREQIRVINDPGAPRLEVLRVHRLRGHQLRSHEGVWVRGLTLADRCLWSQRQIRVYNVIYHQIEN